MERLSPLDALFLHLEDDVNHMHIGSVAIFDGPAPGYAELEAMIAGRLALVPRYRQRVRFVPFQVGRPVWVDDPHFRLGYHVRHTALPRPGRGAQLRALAGRLMSQQLDRTKPLWELWLVEGLEAGRWALLTKVHHCMVDGIAGTDLLAVLLDTTPDPVPPTHDDWRPSGDVSGLRLLGEAAADWLARPYEQVRSAGIAVAPMRAVEALAATGRGLAAMQGLLRAAPPSSLFGRIGPHRRWGWAGAALADVKAVRAAFGGTVNDVVLAVTTRGFRDLLAAHGEDPAEQVVRALIPVSVRRPEERGRYDNRVAAMFAELPVGVAEPVERLAAIRQQLQGLKRSGQAVAAVTLTSLSGFAPPLLIALGTRAATRAGRRLLQRGFSTVVTNVPGPQHPLYALGRRLVEYHPYVSIISPLRTGVAIVSYDGQLSFGVTADWDAVPDVGPLCRGIEAGMAELVKVAAAASRPAPPAARGTRAAPDGAARTRRRAGRPAGGAGGSSRSTP